MNPDDTAQTVYYGIYTIQDVYPGPGLAGIRMADWHFPSENHLHRTLAG
jgi:hypothetical protein